MEYLIDYDFRRGPCYSIHHQTAFSKTNTQYIV